MSYNCPYCGKTCAKSFGLKNHMKMCKAGPITEEHPDDATIIIERDCEAVIRGASGKQGNKNNDVQGHNQQRDMDDGYRRPKFPHKFSAFHIFSDEIPMLLNIDFAYALGNFIVLSGCENKAIMAFGHQLMKMISNE